LTGERTCQYLVNADVRGEKLQEARGASRGFARPVGKSRKKGKGIRKSD